jgi:hypothetical protein
MSRVITHPAFLLDQMDDPLRRPQAGFIPQRLRPAFESVLDLADLLRTQSRFAFGAASLLHPARPLASNAAAHLLTDCRCAPTRHATADWLSSFASMDSPPACVAAPVPRSLCLPLLEIPFLQLNTEQEYCHYIIRQ